MKRVLSVMVVACMATIWVGCGTNEQAASVALPEQQATVSDPAPELDSAEATESETTTEFVTVTLNVPNMT